MATLLDSYEKQYGNLTSEITAKLNNISRLANGMSLSSSNSVSNAFIYRWQKNRDRGHI